MAVRKPPGLPLRYALAFALFLLSIARFSHAAPTIEQGYDAYERGDVAAAVQIWTSLAEAGDSTAQLNLGQLYRQGKGVAASDTEAVKWYSLAAKQGSELAKYNLALMGSEGRAPNYWLSQLAGDDYLVQIMALSNRPALEQFAGKHLEGVAPKPQIVLTRSKGHDWYVLLWGPFDTRELAKEMLGGLPAPVRKNKLWVRTVSSIPAAVLQQR